MRGPGEGFGDVLVVETEGVGDIAVEDDLEIAAAVDEKMRDEAIGVAQFRDADLGDEIKHCGIGEEVRVFEVEARAEVDHHVVEVCARDAEQFVYGFL